MHTTREEIHHFLNDFKIKIELFGVVFMQRDKNLETLISLELTTANRTAYLKNLSVEDYCKGPRKDYNDGPALWEFAIIIRKRDVYIKITMGNVDSQVICISFHIAERQIKHPYN